MLKHFFEDVVKNGCHIDFMLLNHYLSCHMIGRIFDLVVMVFVNKFIAFKVEGKTCQMDNNSMQVS